MGLGFRVWSLGIRAVVRTHMHICSFVLVLVGSTFGSFLHGITISVMSCSPGLGSRVVIGPGTLSCSEMWSNNARCVHASHQHILLLCGVCSHSFSLHMYIHITLYVYVYACTYGYVMIYMIAYCVYAYIYIYIYIHNCISVHVCVCLHKHGCMHTFSIHTHMYMHMCTCVYMCKYVHGGMCVYI